MSKRVNIIEFEAKLDSLTDPIKLKADIEFFPSESFYKISNFRTLDKKTGSVLPTMEIKQKDGKWVLADSEKESYLSQLVGNAIKNSISKIMKTVEENGNYYQTNI
jgi:hypothetical protein